MRYKRCSFLPEFLPELKKLRQKLRKSSGKLNLLIMSLTFLDWTLPLTLAILSLGDWVKSNFTWVQLIMVRKYSFIYSSLELSEITTPLAVKSSLVP